MIFFFALLLTYKENFVVMKTKKFSRFSSEHSDFMKFVIFRKNVAISLQVLIISNFEPGNSS